MIPKNVADWECAYDINDNDCLSVVTMAKTAADLQHT